MSPGKLPVNITLLHKYLAGETCTQEELDIIKQYFTDDFYAPVIRQVMEAEWAHLGTVSAGSAQKDAYYDRFLRTRLQPHRNRRRRTISLVRESMKYAAVAAILLVGITMLYRVKRDNRQEAVTIQWVEKFAARGQRHKLTMPDSTIIYLAPESRIWYPAMEDYMAGQRTVRLEGEAYFEVVHNASRPFTVQTGNLQTVDVGTAFNIRAYPDERNIAVAVAEGEVRVMNTDSTGGSIPKTLVASQGIVFDKNLLQWNDVAADVNGIGQWRKGYFEFASVPLENVIAALVRHYDIRFAWHDPSLKNKRITIQFHGDHLTTALNLLELTAGVRLQKKDNTIWISKK